MKILLAGPVNTADEYLSWIADELPASVQLVEEIADLPSTLSDTLWDLLIIDSDYDSINIKDLFRSIKVVQPHLPLIALCGDDPQEAIDVMRLGISDYLVKPIEKDRLLESIHGVLDENHGKSLFKPATTGEGDTDLNGDQQPPEHILFEGSSKMAAVGQVVDKIIDVNLPVLITGESGTGKEILAKYIHSRSMRKGPFIKVNCAAIPAELLESELFGYERGAFTGAYRRKPGKFEAASGGFLFLDEIRDLPYPLQSKLLHVLQDGTISTLGSTREIKVDVRIIVATNQDLEQCVRNGTFRDDLFFRLNVVHINIPPLRERLRQLETLIDYFRDKFARQYNTQPVHLNDDAKSFLFSYRWPGNIRELENTIRRATVLGGDNLLGNIDGGTRAGLKKNPDLASQDRHEHSLVKDHSGKVVNNEDERETGTRHENTDFPNGLNLKEIAREAALAAEREAIARVLQQTRWNRKKTAQILSVSYKTLLTKIKETGLDEN